MTLSEEEELEYEKMTAHLSEEDKEYIQRVVKNHIENNEIMSEAERLLDEYGDLKNIPEEVFYESEFDTVKLFTFCRVL
jgi:hypothetical protein